MFNYKHLSVAHKLSIELGLVLARPIFEHIYIIDIQLYKFASLIYEVYKLKITGLVTSFLLL